MNIKDLENLKDGQQVIELTGWVDNIRDHGGLTFVDLRDFTGSIQLVFDKSGDVDTKLKNEFYISINGTFKKRDEALINDKILFGDYEIEVTDLIIINQSKTLRHDDKITLGENSPSIFQFKSKKSSSDTKTHIRGRGGNADGNTMIKRRDKKAVQAIRNQIVIRTRN